MQRVNRGDNAGPSKGTGNACGARGSLQRLSCFRRRGILLSAMYPFERFTDAAQTMLTIAVREAEQSMHSYIGTEHLLLAMTSQSGTIAGDTLARLGVTYAEARSRVDTLIGRNERIIIQQVIPTSRVKTVIEMAFAEAQRLDSRVVGTDHVLIAISLEGQGVTAHVLSAMGATLEVLRETIAAVRESGVHEASSGAAPAGGFAGPPRHPVETASPLIDVVMSTATAEMVSDAVTEMSMEHVLRAIVKMHDERIEHRLEALGIDETRLIEALTPPQALVTLRRSLHAASTAKRDAVAREQYEAAEGFRKSEEALRREVDNAEREWESPYEHGDAPTDG